MTIHKGLGIKIKARRNGKSNHHVGDSDEDYSMLISVHNRTHLHDEWWNVELVFVDEVLILSLQLIYELDQALRYATEKPDEYFGGVAIICSGDFFQYPPVGGMALYTPILLYANQSEQEILKHLGRLAWKAVDTVVTLTEQHRMKDDPAFGDAMQCLHVHECTFEDVDLFNEHVIHSPARHDQHQGQSSHCP
jgi:hypothetical protein